MEGAEGRNGVGWGGGGGGGGVGWGRGWGWFFNFQGPNDAFGQTNPEVSDQTCTKLPDLFHSCPKNILINHFGLR